MSLVVLLLTAWFGLLALGVLLLRVTAAMRARTSAKHRGLGQSSVGQRGFTGF